MAYESNTGLGVSAQYNARETGVSVGVESSKDSKHQLSFEFTEAELGSNFLPTFVLPKGATVTGAVLAVDYPFSAGVTITVGEGNSEATNGVALSAGQLAATGTTDVSGSLAGEWAAGSQTTKAARVGLVATGAADNGTGRASLVVSYAYKRRKDDEFAADPATFPQGYRSQFILP